MRQTTKGLKKCLGILMAMVMAITAVPLFAVPASAADEPIYPRALPLGILSRYETAAGALSHIPSDDILPGHNYFDEDDAAMQVLIDRLDRLLGHGPDGIAGDTANIWPLLQLLLKDPADPNYAPGFLDELMDILDYDGELVRDSMASSPKQVRLLLEALLSKYLYQDNIINGLLGALYPILLEIFEDMWSQDIARECKGGSDDPQFFPLYQLLTLADDTSNASYAQTFSWNRDIRFYPNMFGRIIDGDYFPKARQMMASGNRNAGAAIAGLRPGTDYDADLYPVVYKNSWSNNVADNNRYNTDNSAGGTQINAVDKMASVYYTNFVEFIEEDDGSYKDHPDNVRRPNPWSFDADHGNTQFYRLNPDLKDDAQVCGHGFEDGVHPDGGECKGAAAALRDNANEKNPLNIPWEINGDKLKFMRALATVFHGGWPLWAGMLLNTEKTKYNPIVARITAATGTTLDMALYLHATPGFSAILNPIFEALLGGTGTDSPAVTYTLPDTELKKIGAKNPMTTAGMGNPQYAGTGAGAGWSGFSAHVTPASPYSSVPNVHYLTKPGDPSQSDGPMDLVNALFYSLDAVIDGIAKEPVGKILEILPNLAYALSNDRVKPLLDSLDLILQARLRTPGVLGSNVGVQKNLVMRINVIQELSGGGNAGAVIDNVTNLDGLVQQFGLDKYLRDFDLKRLAQFGALKIMPADARETNRWGGWPDKLVFTTRNNKPIIHGGAQDQFDRFGTDEDHVDIYNDVYDPVRYWVEPNKPDVLKDLLHWLVGSGYIPLTMHSDSDWEVVAALAELVLPKEYPAKPVAYGAPNLGPDPFPDWWGAGSAAKARSDGKFIVDNADAVLTAVFRDVLLKGERFSDFLEDMLQGVLTMDTFEDITGKIYGLLEPVDKFIAENDYASLLEDQLLIGGSVFNVIDAVDEVKTFDTGTVTINDPISFAKAFAKYLEPIGPILDFLLAGPGNGDLELLNVRNKNGVVKVLAGSGYELALVPLLKILTDPLGLSGKIWSAADWIALGDNYVAKLEAILEPILAVYDRVLEFPVDSLLAIIPNLIYFISDSADGASPLQQVVDALLAPAYVLIDTARPVIDVLGLDAVSNLLANLPVGLAIDQSGVTVDAIALANSFLDDLVIEGLPLNINIDLGALLLGEFKGAFVAADKPALLWALLNAAGITELIEDKSLTSLFNLLNNPDRIKASARKPDYSMAPGVSAVAYPDWFKPAHAQFLVDNADAVVNWAWRELFAGNPEGKLYVEDYVNKMLNPKPAPAPAPNPDPGPAPAPANAGRESVAMQAINNILFPVSVVMETDGLFGLLELISDLTANEPGEPGDPGDPGEPKDPIKIAFMKDSLEDTIQGIFGVDYFVKDNLTKFVNLMVGIKGTLDGIAIAGQSIDAILAKLVLIDGFVPSLDAIFAPFAAYDPAAVTIKNKNDFMAEATKLLRNFIPLLDVFLADSSLLVINDADVNAGNGFLKLDGSNGYETGLLPLLMGIGADVPGFMDVLVPYNQFKVASGDARLAAILNPIFFLFDSLAKNPVNTVLDVVPNLIYLTSDATGNLLGDMFLDNLLSGLNLNFKLEDLIVGGITEFKVPWNEIGLDDAASYVAVNKADLLTQILSISGAFNLLEENNLTNLIALIGNVAPDKPSYVAYPTVAGKAPIYTWVWTERNARALANNAEDFLNKAFQIFFGKPFGTLPLEAGQAADTFLNDLLGNALYTDDNFKKLLALVQNNIPDIDAILDTQIVPNRTVADILKNIVTVGGNHIDAVAILKHLKTWKPAAKADGQTAFIAALVAYLTPAMPIADFVLSGADIGILVDDTINGGKGLINLYGYDGYQFGLIPIYEALLMPLDAQNKITSAATFKKLNNGAKAQALVNPLLYVIEALVGNPMETLLKMVPNLAYVLYDAKGPSIINQSVDRALFSVNQLLSLFGAAPISFDVGAEVNQLLKTVNLDINTIYEMMIGTSTAYESLSGNKAAKYLRISGRSKADLVTVVMRLLINVLKNDPQMRNMILDLLMDAAGISGFLATIMKLIFRIALWFARWMPWGTDGLLRTIFGWLRAFYFVMPVIAFFQRLF